MGQITPVTVITNKDKMTMHNTFKLDSIVQSLDTDKRAEFFYQNLPIEVLYRLVNMYKTEELRKEIQHLSITESV